MTLQYSPSLEHTADHVADEMLGRCGAAARLVSVELPPGVADGIASQGFEPLADRATVAWHRRDEGRFMVGFGRALELSGGCESALGDAICQVAALKRDAQAGGSRFAYPRLFGGARFTTGGSNRNPAWDGFGGWQFVVPELLLVTRGEGAAASVTLRVARSETRDNLARRVRRALERAFRPASEAATVVPDSFDLSGRDWESRVATALDEIAAGQYRKVVLARQAHVGFPGEAPAIGAVLARLAERYPSCFVFKHSAGGRHWIGASPELLASLSDGVVRAASLAGSRRRSSEPEIDAGLARELWADPKERAEHAFVAAALYEALEPLCTEVRAPSEPQVMSIANIHHLYTPFEGTLRNGASILDVVSRVHPTPAVGGAPRPEALDAIERLEEMDRGWYAGPIGWVDFEGNGEFAVALRSGLVSEHEALLFAGAGIVSGSDPARELAETELKLRPLREALLA